MFNSSPGGSNVRDAYDKTPWGVMGRLFFYPFSFVPCARDHWGRVRGGVAWWSKYWLGFVTSQSLGKLLAMPFQTCDACAVPFTIWEMFVWQNLCGNLDFKLELSTSTYVCNSNWQPPVVPVWNLFATVFFAMFSSRTSLFELTRFCQGTGHRTCRQF